MHVFGLLTQATTLKQLEVLGSATVVFSSPRSGENVEKHFQKMLRNIQKLLTAASQPVIDESCIAEEDFVVGNLFENI